MDMLNDVTIPIEKNIVTLVGRFGMCFTFNHSIHNKNIYSSFMNVARDSGNIDHVPVCINEEQFNQLPVEVDLLNKKFLVRGKIVTSIKNGKHFVMVRITSKFTEVPDSVNDKNEVELEGFLINRDEVRTTPFGRRICEMLILARRGSDKILKARAIAWGKNADYVHAELPIGSKVFLKARFQSRKYIKLINDFYEERETYELSIYYIRKARNEEVCNI